MLNCKEASRLISQSQDRRLSWRERCALKLHLALCDMCREFLRQLELMRTALRRFTHLAENDESVGLSESASERIRKALHEHE